MTKKAKIAIILTATILAAAAAVILVITLGGKDNNAPTGSESSTVSSSTDTENSSSRVSSSENAPENFEKHEASPDSTSVTVDDVDAQRGQKISVPIMLNNNPGIAASAFEIKYNTAKLEYVGYTEGEVFENYFFKEMPDSICFSNIENGDSHKTGVMFTLEFNVKDDAVLGDTEIEINIDDESFINFDEEFIKVEGSNAIVTIK